LKEDERGEWASADQMFPYAAPWREDFRQAAIRVIFNNASI
jgi:hypothetical protein